MDTKLLRRSKARHEIKGIQKNLRLDFFNDLNTDDVIASLAFGEAERRASARTSGDKGKQEQRISDELKVYLVTQQEA